MSHPALLARLAGRPLAIAPRSLDSLLASSVVARSGADALVLRPADAAPARGYAMTDSGIAVVPVVGPLVTRGDWLSALFGAMSYGDVRDAVEGAFTDPASRAVLLEVDSPGGEVGGLFDLVDRLAALRGETGKPLWAVAGEAALSAAYAIASTAERIYVTRTGEVGSVGVVAVHIDESAADAMAGLKWTLIHAGARKVDGNSHEPLSGTAFAAIQADVDALHAELVALVARNRDMAPDAVRATEAAVYRGRRGIDVGLADRLGSMDQAFADLAVELEARASRPARRDSNLSFQPSRSMSMTTDVPAGEAPAAQVVADPPEAPAAPPAPAEAPAPSAAEARAEALRAEYAEIAAVAAQAVRLGVAVDAADAMARGTRPDALRRSVLDALAARADAAEVVAAVPAAPVPGSSPIVRRAQLRAAEAKPARP